MTEFEIWTVVGVVAVFGLFGAALAYVNLVASARAITFEEERIARGK